MEEDIKTIKNHYVFTTNHVLDDENKRFKQAIENLINKYKEQEKMIEFMASCFWRHDLCENEEGLECKKMIFESECKNCIIEHFRKKAKGE